MTDLSKIRDFRHASGKEFDGPRRARHEVGNQGACFDEVARTVAYRRCSGDPRWEHDYLVTSERFPICAWHAVQPKVMDSSVKEIHTFWGLQAIATLGLW